MNKITAHTRDKKSNKHIAENQNFVMFSIVINEFDCIIILCTLRPERESVQFMKCAIIYVCNIISESEYNYLDSYNIKVY